MKIISTSVLNLEKLQKFDVSKMHQVYDKWTEIALEYYERNLTKLDFYDLSHIVFAGMGGSGTIGDIFAAILSKKNIHVSLVKGYHLPKTVDSNTLVVVTSVSGNTIESLTVLDLAKKTKSKIIAFSSGGKMKNYCIKNKIEFYEIPNLHSPRASLPAFLYSIINVIEPVINLKKTDVIESILKLKETQKHISSTNLTSENPALALTEWITDIPIIYYPWGLQAAAIRFKNSLQENAKIHAVVEEVLEACHNGIVAWERQSNIKPILIEGKDDYFKTKKSWRVLKEYFATNKIEFREIFSVEGNILSKLIQLIYFLDYTSIYHALISEIDPTPVKSIDFIKRRLARG
jgi:glucose/mannose-6-phosphate isomerase